MNSVSIAIFAALLGLLAFVRLTKMEYLKKSHITVAILMFISVGCAIEMLSSILKWRISVSWFLAAIACIVLSINILINEHYYIKKHIEEEDNEMDEKVEEFQEFGEIELEIPEDFGVDTKTQKGR